MTRNPDIHKARKLRQAANTPEQRAWDVLRKFRKRGFAFRRQHPIGGYIVDFACIPERLVIEIDGSVHDREHVAIKDTERQAYIERIGWRVVRVPAETARSVDHLYGLVSQILGLD